MALLEALQGILEEMESESQITDDAGVLRAYYAKQIRVALKSAEGSVPQGGLLADPRAFNRQMIDAAREEFKKNPNPGQALAKLDANGLRMAELADDPGTYAPTDGAMPTGAYTEVAGTVYQLREDGRLHPKG